MTQLISGTIAEKFGGKWVFASAGLFGAIASLVSPVAARAGKGWLIAARALLGAGQVIDKLGGINISQLLIAGLYLGAQS